MSDIIEDLEDLGNGWVTLKNGKRALLIASGDDSMPKVPADQYFSISNGAPTTLADPAVVDTYSLRVTDPANFSIGDVILLVTTFASYVGQALIIVGDVITVDSLINFAFPAGTPASSRSREMTVDGSTTPVKFEIFIPAGTIIDQINVCRLMMTCLTTATVDLSKFGDIVGGLTRGMILRGVPDPSTGIPTTNSWNAKTNSDLALLAYDWDPHAAANPIQGQDGFLWRYTWGGDDKHGVIPSVNIGDKIELIIQDDITSILDLKTLYGGNFLLTGII